MRTPLLLLLALAAAPAWADPALDAVAELGRINGLALACQQPQVVARAKELMIAHVPKTRSHGEAFEAATSQAYTRVPGGCPDGAALRLELEVAAGRLQSVLPTAR
jgi:hypothetical protein